jgi:hypothetical protein
LDRDGQYLDNFLRNSACTCTIFPIIPVMSSRLV